MTAFSDQLEMICEQIASEGLAVIEDALPKALSEQLLQGLQAVHPDAFAAAGIGRRQDFHTNPDIRSDQILWLDETMPAIQDYLAWIETLRLALNQAFYLGLFEYECMFAHYAVGASYQKHVDAFKGDRVNNRKVSTILYLNPDWQAADGGELLLYHEDEAQPFRRIAPNFGQLVVFLSEVFPHEVLPAKKSRYSLTGWFRTKA